MWILKGGVILAVGDQPPLLFEIPVVCFPLALVGLRGLVGGEASRAAAIGGVLAWAAVAGALVAGAYGVLVASPSDVVLGVGIGVCALSMTAALVLLGLAVRSTGALPTGSRNLPLLMGVATVPSMTVIAGILEAIHERLLEVPIVAFGVAWVALGLSLWSARDAVERRPSSAAGATGSRMA